MQNDKKKKEGYRDHILTITSKMTTTKSYLEFLFWNFKGCSKEAK